MNRIAMLALPVLLCGCAALSPPAPTAPEFIVPPGAEFVSDLFGYSQAVRVGPWVTVSAVPGFDVERRAFPETFAEQAHAGFDNLRRVLEGAGATMDEVVEITTHQLDMAEFNTTVDARNEAFGLHRPAWTAAGVASLPLPSMQFQVGARAYSPLDRRTQQKKTDAAPPSAPNADAQSRRFHNRPGY